MIYFFSWQDMLEHTNGFDVHVTVQRRKTTCIVKLKLHLNLSPLSSRPLLPSAFTPLHPSACRVFGRTEVICCPSGRCAGAVIPPLLPKHPWTIHFLHPSVPYPPVPAPPSALIPIPGRSGGIRCQCPRKTPLSGTCGGSAAVLFRGLSFTVWDFHSSVHVSIASQVLAHSKSNFQDSNQLMYSYEKHENYLVYLYFILVLQPATLLFD